jgi:hypothetical protein
MSTAIGGMILMAKPESSGTNLFQSHYVHHKSQIDVSRIEPGVP